MDELKKLKKAWADKKWAADKPKEEWNKKQWQQFYTTNRELFPAAFLEGSSEATYKQFWRQVNPEGRKARRLRRERRAQEDSTDEDLMGEDSRDEDLMGEDSTDEDLMGQNGNGDDQRSSRKMEQKEGGLDEDEEKEAWEYIWSRRRMGDRTTQPNKGNAEQLQNMKTVLGLNSASKGKKLWQEIQKAMKTATIPDKYKRDLSAAKRKKTPAPSAAKRKKTPAPSAAKRKKKPSTPLPSSPPSSPSPSGATRKKKSPPFLDYELELFKAYLEKKHGENKNIPKWMKRIQTLQSEGWKRDLGRDKMREWLETEARKEKLQEEVEGLKGEIKAKDAEILRVQGELKGEENLQEKIAALNEEIAELNKTPPSVSPPVSPSGSPPVSPSGSPPGSAGESTLDTLRRKKAELEEKLRVAETSLETETAEAATLRTALDEARALTQGKEERYQRLLEEVEAGKGVEKRDFEEQMADLLGQLKGSQQEKEALEREKKDRESFLGGELGELQKQLEREREGIQTLEKKVGALKGEKKELERQLSVKGREDREEVKHKVDECEDAHLLMSCLTKVLRGKLPLTKGCDLEPKVHREFRQVRKRFVDGIWRTLGVSL